MQHSTSNKKFELNAVLENCPFFLDIADADAAKRIMNVQPDYQFMLRASREPNRYINLVYKESWGKGQTAEIKLERSELASILSKDSIEDAVKALEKLMSELLWRKFQRFLEERDNPFKAIPSNVLQQSPTTNKSSQGTLYETGDALQGTSRKSQVGTQYETFGATTDKPSQGTLYETGDALQGTSRKSQVGTLYETDALQGTSKGATQQGLFASANNSDKLYAVLVNSPFYFNNTDERSAKEIINAQPDYQFMLRASRDSKVINIVYKEGWGDHKTTEIKIEKSELASILSKPSIEDAVKELEKLISEKLWKNSRDFTGLRDNPYKAIPSIVLQPSPQKHL